MEIGHNIDHICIALQNNNNKFEDQNEFFKTNYNKLFMIMGDEDNKLYYDSYKDLKVRGEYRFVESKTLLSQRLNARGGEG
jgi:hypothetical protein